ncbi:MAG: SIS domain-containing protein [Candidatus Scalindua rubra]|uniref:Phosphoheptose isomerase n=1 Tax=Candidatus Scalindua brodae TaxID=237368 RepID=A0A0B0ETU6_9BACT|nr:MAG: phosphoheptose isomerase [Candidatus Scalindua brodae]MBZ0109653.1 SIS domain-containing protein [Candidatus Scalindua rubra]TWU33092.1 Phosphoheptose isomerase [Candidatus Brocadiaceae bacterium S225]
MKYLEKLFEECNEGVDYFNSYFKYLNDLQKTLDASAIKGVINCFINARENGKTIYFAGNGGSAATASHFAQDLGEVGRKAGVHCFKTHSLTGSAALLTALGNDYGYDKLFSIQISELCSEGDVLVAISASGNSPNIIEAVKQAKEMGGITIGLVGFDGGKLLKMCDYVVRVKANKGEYGPVEDIHMILDHIITSFLTFRLMSEKVETK